MRLVTQVLAGTVQALVSGPGLGRPCAFNIKYEVTNKVGEGPSYKIFLLQLNHIEQQTMA